MRVSAPKSQGFPTVGIQKGGFALPPPTQAHSKILQPKLTSSENTITQFVKMPATVTGITHMVSAVSGSIFEGHELPRELRHGQAIVVETDDKIRSRRGPNQESFRKDDKTSHGEYRWIRITHVEGKELGPNIYIRDDAFTGGAHIPRGSAYRPTIYHRERQGLTGTIPLREKYPVANGRYASLYHNGLLEKFEALQMLLRNQGAVHKALEHLEMVAGHFIRKGSTTATHALNMALHFMESRWMNGGFIDLRESAPAAKPARAHADKPNSKRTMVVQNSDPHTFQQHFLSHVVSRVVPFKDVGAPLFHGEYAHRIQWYIIAYHYLGSWGAQVLKQLHATAAVETFLQQVKNTPSVQDWRSLWDYVMDVRRTADKEFLGGSTDGVYAASPVRLTSEMLGYSRAGVGFKAGTLARHFPLVHEAVSNRLRKRALERAATKSPLTNSEQQELVSCSEGYKARKKWVEENTN